MKIRLGCHLINLSSVEMRILAQFALIDPDLCTLVTHLKVKVNGP